MRPAVFLLALSAFLLITPASAQSMEPQLTLAVRAPFAGLDDGEVAAFQGEVARFCPNSAAVLDSTPVEFHVEAPPELLVQVTPTSFGQQLCASEPESHAGFDGTIRRLGGEPGTYTFEIVAYTNGSEYYGSSQSGPASIAVVFNGTDQAVAASVEGPTADTPFPALAAPLALAAVALARRRS